MFDDINLNDEADAIRAALPSTTKRLIAALRLDLNFGPVHHWQDKGPCLWGGVDTDRPSRPFNFSRTLASVRDRLDHIEDVTVTLCDVDPDTGEDVEWDERIDGSREAILRRILGAELAAML